MIFYCPHCPARFENTQKKGGHISKAHKGMSAAYKAKMEKREARTDDRVSLVLAKSLFQRFSSYDPKTERALIGIIGKAIMSTRR